MIEENYASYVNASSSRYSDNVKNIALFIAYVAMAVTSGAANAADSFPSRPIRLIIPSGAGGITDILARYIAPKLGDAVG